MFWFFTSGLKADVIDIACPFFTFLFSLLTSSNFLLSSLLSIIFYLIFSVTKLATTSKIVITQNRNAILFSWNPFFW